MIGKLLNNLDRKYAFGLLTGLLFGFLSVYTDFFRSTSPQIQFDVLSNTTVVDLKENIGKIDILYDSTSILSNKQTLSIITLKIANIGNSDVLKNFYDNHSPLGFKVGKGIILEKPTLIQSSNSYIAQNIGLATTNQSQISFADFIFEKGEFFVLKVLVLHNISERPEIIPQGKVAGVKKIEVVKSYLSKETKSFWQRVIDGSVVVHVTRFVAYSLAFFLLMIAIIFPIAFSGEILDENRRKRKLKEFKIYLRRPLSEGEILAVDFFLENGKGALKLFMKSIKEYQKLPHLNKSINPDFEPQRMMHQPVDKSLKIAINDLIDVLKERGYILAQGGKLEFKDNLDLFIDQLLNFIEME